jgi:uncharacterized protein YecE (DUF72 family)
VADSPLQPALVVIAVAVSVQTVLLLVGIVAGALAWRRWQERFEHRYALIAARLDDTLHQTREAAVALRHASEEAARSFDEVRQTVRTATTVATAPRNLLLAGVTAAGALFARWRRQRRGYEGDQNQ